MFKLSSLPHEFFKIGCSNKLSLCDVHTLPLVEVSFKSLEISLFLLRLSLYFLQESVACIWGVCWPCLLSLQLWFMCFSSCVYKLSGIATCSDSSQLQLFSATSFTGQVVCSTEAAQGVQPHHYYSVYHILGWQMWWTTQERKPSITSIWQST